MALATRCPRDCSDSCILVAQRADGVITLGAHPTHGPTMGFICPKTRGFLPRLDSPHRIREPWILRGGHFHPVSWEDALDEIAAKLSRAIIQNPSSVALIRGYASMGASKAFATYLFEKIGARTTSGSLCDSAGIEAITADAGALSMNMPSEIDNARGIVIWGKSPASSLHLAARVERAVKRGIPALAVAVDKKSIQNTVSEVILTRPGCDRFLALAASKILLERNPQITPWRKARNGGEFLNFIRALKIEELLFASGNTYAEARKIADFYAASQKTATLAAWGLQRNLHGGQNVRAIHALCFLADTLGKSGGGFYYNISSSRHLKKPSGREQNPPEPLSLPNLAADLKRLAPEMLFVVAMNPVNQCPDSKAVREALRAVPTTVVCDAFWSDTARAATIVLPIALWPEEEDLCGSSMWDEISMSKKIVPPPEGVKTDFQVMSELAARIGVNTGFDTKEKWLSACLPEEGPTLSELREEIIYEFDGPKVAWADGFGHEDGKFRLLTELSPEEAPDPKHPLKLISHVRSDAIHSQILPEEQKAILPARLSPSTAAKFGLEGGSLARLVSRTGELECEIHLDDGVHPECVAVPRGGWGSLGRGVNEITEPLVSDLGDCAALYSTGVRLEPADDRKALG